MSSPIPAAWAPEPGRPGSVPLPVPLPEVRVGDYRLLVKIGEGGMGVVHLARKSGGERVALKVLRPHIVGDQEARARLGREVASLRRVRSRWVAEILDADPWAVVPFVATRYVPGLSLHDHVVQEGPVLGRDLLWFAGCLAEGLSSVHEVGVLHRDVKPSNVLMEGRTPILIDFGLARVADDPRLTHTGWLLGTPGYLAPEILYGEDATEASDVHSWAATVAYAATGSPPFGRGPAMAIMDRVRRGEHDLLTMSGPLREVVTAALDPEPTRRPDLAAILDWLRPASTRPTDPPRPPPFAPSAAASPAPAAPTSGWEADMTTPLGLTAREGTPTDHLAQRRSSATRAPVTRTLTVVGDRAAVSGSADPRGWWDRDEQDVAGGDQDRDQRWDDGVWEPWVAPPTPWAERARRASLLLGAGVLLAAGLAAYPWVALVLTTLLVVLLRAGATASSGAEERRTRRGRRWYDGPRLLLGAPWDLVRSLPSTLVLGLFMLGLSASAALVVYAVLRTGLTTGLAAGSALGVATWWGPGGDRVRDPVGGLLRPVARAPAAWVIALALLVVVALALGAAALDGPDWAPYGRPSLLGLVAGG